MQLDFLFASCGLMKPFSICRVVVPTLLMVLMVGAIHLGGLLVLGMISCNMFHLINICASLGTSIRLQRI